jgi:type IV pilus assembly protein PilP
MSRIEEGVRRILVSITSVAVVSGCSMAGGDDLRTWMVEQRNGAKPKVEPIKEPTRFVPEAYTQIGQVSPFSADKLTIALRNDASKSGNDALVAPELKRRKEPLEAMPLDSMGMVGVMDKNNQKVALVKVDNLLYQVKVGNYLGQNYGRITRISESEITMREIVQDGAGEWTERAAALQLQEGIKK